MWFKKDNILLEQAGQDGGSGGNGGSSDFQLEDAFSDVDDFDISGLGGSESSDKGDGSEGSDKGDSTEGGDKGDDKGDGGEDTDETLKAEAEEKGISVDELKVQKEKDSLEIEAKEKGVSVDDLKKEKSEAKEKSEKIESERKKTLDDLEKELKDEGKSEEEIKKAIDTKKQEFQDSDFDSEINPFNEYTSPESKSEGDKVEINYNDLAKDIGYEIEEGVEIKSIDEFKEISKNNLEKAKQTLDLSEFPPEAKMLLENLKKNNNIQLTDFYRNDTIRSIDNFLSLPEEQKIKSVLAEEGKKAGHDKESLKDYIEDQYAEMTEDDMKKKLTVINRQATSIKTKEFGKIISEKGKYLEAQKEKVITQAKKERENLVEVMKKTTSYMNFKIPDNVLNSMVKDIESGAFQNVLDENVEQAKINAYIGLKLGKQFAASYEKMLKKAKGTSYQKGLDTLTKQKHNIKNTGNKNLGKRKSSDLSFSSDEFSEE